jgi:signal peptidase I
MFQKNKDSFKSLKKCRHLLHEAIIRYKAISKRLLPEPRHAFEQNIEELSHAIENNNLEAAQTIAVRLSQFLHAGGKKSFFDHTKEFVIAIILALLIAGVVRQTWFELYEIPTGSMRPTFKECDRVLVTKDAFGINTPFQTSHLYFDSELINRGEIVVITGDNLELSDVDTTYFGIFPGKRRYVKRLVAKGGDTIYFYGGKIFGVSKEGSALSEMEAIEHIPFITFEGKVDQSGSDIYLRHMNIPIAKLELSSKGIQGGEITTPSGWQKEALQATGDFPHAFNQFWGLNNYAMARLIEPQALPQEAKTVGIAQDDAVLYLELKHSPTLAKKSSAKQGGLLQTRSSWIALDDAHAKRLAENLYTARFYVQHGRVYRYTPEGPDLKSQGFFLSDTVPDGCYEFYNGIAYRIGYGAIAEQLDKSHPIYPQSAKEIKTLYNSGIELRPNSGITIRYAYFRDGDLYTLGAPLFTKDEETLRSFVESETKRKELRANYIPFVDAGRPSVETIRGYGLQIPEKHYLLFGDNHAMSNDSRFFGAVPEQNLQGSPALIFWPTGSRWGAPPQPALAFFRVPQLIVWVTATIFTIIILRFLARRSSMQSYYKAKAKLETK